MINSIFTEKKKGRRPKDPTLLRQQCQCRVNLDTLAFLKDRVKENKSLGVVLDEIVIEYRRAGLR